MVCVCIRPLETISIYNDSSSIMLNVADRIKVVEADVSSIQKHKRQQCPLSSQKKKCKKMKKKQQGPYLTMGGPWGGEQKATAQLFADRKLTQPDLFDELLI